MKCCRAVWNVKYYSIKILFHFISNLTLQTNCTQVLISDNKRQPVFLNFPSKTFWKIIKIQFVWSLLSWNGRNEKIFVICLESEWAHWRSSLHGIWFIIHNVCWINKWMGESINKWEHGLHILIPSYIAEEGKALNLMNSYLISRWKLS